jgi:lysophospholipase L1-like esterase
VHRGKAFVAAVVASIVLLAACSGDDSTSTGPTSTPSPTTAAPSSTTTAAPRAPKPARGDAYVALGSSIASGFGISVQSTDCGRSSRNYPQLLAQHFGLALTDVSCGAAVIPNILDTPQNAHPPQIDAVAAGTKLITVTVGGNDIGYNGKAVACGDPASECTASPTLDDDLATTRTRLTDLIDALHAAAPSATLVFTTYPREVPDGNCPALAFTDAEAAIVRDMGATLEQLFVDVLANRDDIVFVDPYTEPGDHTGCAPENERWTAGHDAPDGFAYHPTALGHEVMARMIVTALT